jgi:predicted ATPase
VLRASAFVGRDGDVDRLLEASAGGRLVTVTGPGGVGKTRLVHEALTRFRERFGSDVRVLSLAGAEVGADVGRLCADVGVDSPEALGAGPGSALVVLDSCEHVLDGAAELVRRLLAANEDLTVVATSREALRLPGERVMVLQPLPTPVAGDPAAVASPAVRLFLDSAAAAGATLPDDDATTEAIVTLCARLDGLPLALELAGGRSRAMTPLELLDHTDQRLELLRSRGTPGGGREQSVRVTIELSYDLLTPSAQRDLQRLAVLQAPFDAELANAVIGGSDGDLLATRELLADLVDRSLLVTDQGGGRTRFWMLELIRDVVLERAEASGERAVAQEAFVEVVRARGVSVFRRVGDPAGTLVASASLTPHLVAALEWCLEHDTTPDRSQWLLLPLLAGMQIGGVAQAGRLGERLLDRWPDDMGEVRAEALTVIASALAVEGRGDRAEVLARRALELPEALPFGRVMASWVLATVAIARGEGPAAVDHARAGQAAAAAAGIHTSENALRGTEAWGLLLCGQLDEASLVAEAAVDAADRAHDPIAELWGLLVARTVAARRGDWRQVAALAQQAQAVIGARTEGWWRGTIGGVHDLAHTACATAMLEGWAASLPQWSDALDRALGGGVLGQVATILHLAAMTAARCGDLDAAEALRASIPAAVELQVPSVFDPDPLLALGPAPARDPGRSLAASIRAAQSVLVHVDDDSPVTLAEAAPSVSALVRSGDGWQLSFAGRRAALRDLKGLGSLATLLGRPNTDVHCLEVMGGFDVASAPGPAIDGKAQRDYQARIVELQSEIDDAQQANDPARAARAEVELDALVEHLSEALGLGGRDRGSGSSVQRARAAATYRLRSAIKRIGQVHPDLGRHLENSVRTGVWCSYRPERPITWDVTPG